ncbi:IclR family transcriptional regulator C-terminal domain-containing protein [Saxibacter everestensis]|uniref:IclR family transcriptional regulator C-terminal domain-containing protein n=1 Tax=Saxibacter everestensis TaxID=2909229 RepID=A0ABY8QUC8_9MICO|nr:IclR family transcriptional regulator C-terminal domain-containing protein [Brevibacteriaceae bacterium ZFBP1038]
MPESSIFVQSLERGLGVIRAFDAKNPELTLSEVSRRTGLTRAAARRFLHTLVELGYMRTDGRLFALRPKILELGYAYLSSLTFPEIAQPHLEEFVRRHDRSSSGAVLSGTDIVYVVRVPTQRIMRVSITLGTRFPAYATSMGRVLLAGLPPEQLDGVLDATTFVPFTAHTVRSADELRTALDATRERGYAVIRQELEDGVCSIAVPVRDRDGATIAAINCSVSAQEALSATLESDVLPDLRAAAGAIESDLKLAGR